MYTTKTDIQAAKDLLASPGDTLQEALDHVGMSQVELALRMGRPVKTVNEIVKGVAEITPETALQLERVLDVPADFWLEKERLFQLEKAKIAESEQVFQNSEWVRQFPLAEMCRRGILTQTRNTFRTYQELVRYFRVASGEAFDAAFLPEQARASFRISLQGSRSPYAVAAWLCEAGHRVRGESWPEFEPSSFRRILTDLQDLMLRQPSYAPSHLQERCRSVGVAVIYTPAYKNTGVSGAARWIDISARQSVPTIQLSGRYNTNDRFWFNFFHEAGHILLHGKRGYFVDDEVGLKIDLGKEAEANEFAEKHLISADSLEPLRGSRISRHDVDRLAAELNVHPGIVVGRLQKMEIIPYSYLNGLKVKVNLFGT